MNKLLSIIFVIFICAPSAISQSEISDSLSYAWRLTGPLAKRERVEMDTLLFDYAQRFVPSTQSIAYATTGNYGSEGINLDFSQRHAMSDFFFKDALKAWLPSKDKTYFFNTRMPITALSYNFGGGKQMAQDILDAVFSGNINSKSQVGAFVKYVHSKGSYANQSAKDLQWGFSGSYLGEKYQFEGFWYHYNSVNLENGGITNDLYITDPAEIQGGIADIDSKSIPTRLTAASSRVIGGNLYLVNRYNLGFYDEISKGDSLTDVFVPVVAFSLITDFKQFRHEFHNFNSRQGDEFWSHRYLSNGDTQDNTSAWTLANTFGITLLEGFKKWSAFDVSAFAKHEYQHLTQTADTVNRTQPLPYGLTPLPFSRVIPSKALNRFWVGGEISRTKGNLLNFSASAQFGILGDAVGDVIISGDVATKFKLLADSIKISAYGTFSNTTVPYLIKYYYSNHFAWENDFGKTRNFSIGGKLDVGRTNTVFGIELSNIQNHIYFNAASLPTQCKDNVQVFTLSLKQNLHWKALHWDNSLIYQETSEASVIPLPRFAINSNLYLWFKIAKVLQVQFGVDCDYYTKYKGLAYQPATMSFYNQDKIELGNYPFMNLYLNMKLKRTRFYLMMSHINQGWFGKNYFSLPSYPLNPRRFQLGVSIDFVN